MITINSIYNLFMAALPSSRTQWSTYLLIPLQAIIKKVIIFLYSDSLPTRINWMVFFVLRIYFILFLYAWFNKCRKKDKLLRSRDHPLNLRDILFLRTLYWIHLFVTWSQLDHWLFFRRKNCQHNCSWPARCCFEIDFLLII